MFTEKGHGKYPALKKFHTKYNGKQGKVSWEVLRLLFQPYEIFPSFFYLQDNAALVEVVKSCAYG
jgi:hypothetical protein